VKVVDEEPAVTVTEAGMVSSALSLDTVTVVPPAGAPPLRLTVQVVDAPETRLVELQVSEEREADTAAGVRFRVALLEAPPSVAVTVAA
jgi:hypothetical protein